MCGKTARIHHTKSARTRDDASVMVRARQSGDAVVLVLGLRRKRIGLGRVWSMLVTVTVIFSCGSGTAMFYTGAGERGGFITGRFNKKRV